MTPEYVWLAGHPKKKASFRGRYIAVVGDEIVSSGTDLADVIAKARPHEKGGRRILISLVPTKEVCTA